MPDYRLRLATAADAAAICAIYNQGIEDRVATLETELRTPEERRQWLATRDPRHPVIVAELANPATFSASPPTPLPEHAPPAPTNPATSSTSPPTPLPEHAPPAPTNPATSSTSPPTPLPEHAPPAPTNPATFSASPPTPLPEQAAPATTVTTGWGSLNVFNARPAYRHVADFSIYIERAWRGKGVGRVLLTRLIELGREHSYHKLVLSAFPFNAGGMALYEKLGFRTVGIYKEQGRLDGRWVDTIIMEKIL